jgi:hypothetical protein
VRHTELKASVVTAGDGLESLLACCIPNLKLHDLALELHSPNFLHQARQTHCPVGLVVWQPRNQNALQKSLSIAALSCTKQNVGLDDAVAVWRTVSHFVDDFSFAVVDFRDALR